MLGRVPVRQFGEHKDMRHVLVLAGPDRGEMKWVNKDALTEVQPKKEL